MSQAKTYAITDAAVVAAKIRAAGGPQLDPTVPTGRAAADGVTIGWSIAHDRITVTVISKPWVVPYGAIWSHIDPLFATN